MGRQRVEPGFGQESVWDYPRPPRMEDVEKKVKVVFGEITIAYSLRAKRVLETSHPPVYYLPPDDIAEGVLVPAGGSSYCEFKGSATYWSLVVGGRSEPEVAWSYGRALATRDWPALWRSIRAEWTRRASTGSGFGHRPVGSTAAGSPTSDDVNPIWPHHDGLKWTQEVRSHI